MIKMISKPILLITCGPCGTGKTTFCKELAPKIDAIHLQFDITRKRLYGIELDDHTHQNDKELYGPKASKRTAFKILETAEGPLRDGRSVIVDGCYLLEDHREDAHERAMSLGVRYAVLVFDPPEEDIIRNFASREENNDSPSDGHIGVYRNHKKIFETPKGTCTIVADDVDRVATIINEQ